MNCFKGLTPLLTPLNTIIHPYKLHDTELKTTNNAKYLGVTLNNDFNFSTHINNVSSKANNTLKFIKRNIKTENKKLKETAYNTYVRPQLEYCSTIWHFPGNKTSLTR